MKFLFDLGGVFFNWDPRHFYKNIFTSEEELDFFLENVCNNDWNIKQDAGRSIEEAENELVLRYPKYIKEIKMYYPNHRKMIKNTFNQSIEILLKLISLNYQCYVLSNWSSETFIGMKYDYPFLNKFSGMIISGEDRLIKPDNKIYKLAIDRFNLIPEKTVFIDDKLENINAAQKLNFKVIHLQNPNLIEEKIKIFIESL